MAGNSEKNFTDIFSSGQNVITINSLDSMVKFTRFNTNRPALFFEGLELAEDLKFEKGMLLYPKDTLISRERLFRLLLLRKSNPNLEFKFKIKLSDIFLEKFRSEIKRHFNTLLERRKAEQRYKRFFKELGENLNPILEQLLEEDKITLTLYKLLFMGESAKTRRAVYFFDHAFEVALFSLAIALSDSYSNIIRRSRNKLVEIAKAGLFHNYGALIAIDRVLESPEEKRLQAYWEAIRSGCRTLGELELDAKVVDSILHLCEYSMEKLEFIQYKEWPAVMANIVLVAVVFLQKERGLFGDPQPVKLVVDQLNGRAMEGGLGDLAVESLTIELNLRYIFHFYHMMEDLRRECPYKSAVPYPLTGYKSPTVFICEKTVRECPFLEGSRTTVNLVKDLGELRSGKYCRCSLLTPQLMTFYDKHYEKIKDSAVGP